MIQVKVCGITRLEDAQVAIEAGADLLGFVFYRKSPRCIAPEQARLIIDRVCKDSSVRFAGVFVNASLQEVYRAVELAQVDLIQLHGDEPTAMLEALGRRAYKALPTGGQGDRILEQFRAHVTGHTPAFIVDAFSPGQYGGTGRRADWETAARIARQYPILLAGGLTANNVEQAVRRVQPWGVDVSSGVEQSPGIKDHIKIREFVAQAKHMWKEH